MRTLSIPRLAAIRLRRRWPLELALGVGVAAAVALATVFPLVGAAAQEVGFRSYYDSLGAKRFVTVEVPGTVFDNTLTYDSFQKTASDEVSAQAPGLLLPGARYLASSELQPLTLNGSRLQVAGSDPHPTVGYFEGLERHVTLVAGAWPQPAAAGTKDYGATVPETGADQLALKVGDQYCVTTTGIQSQSFCARITGVWRPLRASDPYWGPTAPPRILTLTRDGADLLQRQVPNALFRWGAVFYANAGAIHAYNADEVSQRLRTLRGFFAVRRDGNFSTGLDRALDAFTARAQVAQFTLQLVGAQLLLIALFFVAFASGHVLEQQAATFATWRARGWAPIHLFALLLLEFAALVAVGVPAGLGLAWVATWALTGTMFHVSPQIALVDPAALWRPVVLAALAVLAVLAVQAALAARRVPVSARRALSRPEARPWWRRRNLDLVLAAVSVPLLAELRLRGSAGVRTAGDISDPISNLVGLALPAAAMAVLALAALRLLPLGVRLLRPLRVRPAAALAGWQLDRRPGQHAQLALLVAFTVAIGVFAGIYATTERRNAADRVSYAAGADLRVRFAQTYQPAELDGVISSLHGVSAASQVLRARAQPGNSALEATLLAIQPGSFRQVAWTRDDLAAQPVSGLLGRLAQRDGSGLALTGPTPTLSLWVNSPGLAATLTADLVDSAGTPIAIPLGGLDQPGWRQLKAAVPRVPAAPLRLLDLEFASTGGAAGDGVVALSDLGAGDAVVEDFQRGDGWWRWPVPTFQDSALAGSMTTPRDGRPTSRVEVHLAHGRAWVRPAPATGPIPALLSTGTLQRLGIGLFQQFDLRLDGRKVPLVAVAEIGYFPTLYPQLEDFIVAAREPLLGRLARDGDPGAWPNEAWLKVGFAEAMRAAEQLRQRGDVVELSDRATLADLAAHEPLRLDLVANLALGFGAALGLAVLGFGLHFFVAARGRLSEYAILRANGLAKSTIRASLLVEQGVLLGFSLLAGAALGAVLCLIVLPSLELAADLHDTVPPTVVTVDPVLTAGTLLAVLLGALAAGGLAAALGTRAHLLDELRMSG
jgi:hypothetical protein